MTTERQDNDNAKETDDLADIVAYLDGEMEEPAIELMERRLVSDDPLRRKADALDQTWHLLDSLDDVSASGEFISRTLSSIDVVDSDTESASQHRPWTQLFRQNEILPAIIGWVMFGFLLATIGLLTGRVLAQPRRGDNDAQILHQLPVLRNYHQYRIIPDLQFLEDLPLPNDAQESQNQAP
jgi:anti-sigma factor RsiW